LAVSEALPEDDCFEDINAFGEFVDLEDLWKFFANIVTHLEFASSKNSLQRKCGRTDLTAARHIHFSLDNTIWEILFS
jgi:hypothetical protein